MGVMSRTALDAGTTGAQPTNTQTAVPTTGQTVACADTADDIVLILNPAGLLALLTVTLPTEAKSRMLQTVRIVSLKAITLFSVNGATTILGAPATLALGASATFQKVAANTWVKV